MSTHLSPPPDSLPYGMRRDAATRRLLVAIFEGQFDGHRRLRVEHLAKMLGTSATPIREALVELASLGIVELRPNRGAILRPFSAKEFFELCQMRSILEGEAARGACGRIASVVLRNLATEFSRLSAVRERDEEWLEETRRFDNQLHDLIAANCGNDRLALEIRRYRDLYRTLRDVYHKRQSLRGNYSQLDENEEHLAIVRAVIAEKPNEAADAMRSHLNAASQRLKQFLFAQP